MSDWWCSSPLNCIGVCVDIFVVNAASVTIRWSHCAWIFFLHQSINGEHEAEQAPKPIFI